MARLPDKSEPIPLTFLAAAASCMITVAYWRLVARPSRMLGAGLSDVARGRYGMELDVPAAGPLRDATLAFNEASGRLARGASSRDDFITNVSHEFKTPLAYIQHFAMLLQQDDISDSDRKEYLGAIVSGTKRMSKMVSGMLELAMADDPDSMIAMRSFSLDEQIRHVLATFVPLMDQKGIGFNVELEDTPVWGNETMLGEVWSNLLSNAVKFTPSGGLISVKLHTDDDRAIVTIEDTGIGMDANRLDRVFDRFYHLDDESNREGTGLGLTISKAIVDKHEGSIELESAVGSGTTCTVKLPLNRHDPAGKI